MSFTSLKALIERLNSNQTFRHGVLFTFFSFLNNGINFVLLIVLAKYISPDGYGELNLFNTFILLVSVIISLNSNGYISVRYFNKTVDEFPKLILSVFIITTVVLIFLFLIQLIFFNRLEMLIGLSGNFQIIGLLVCYFQIFNTVNLDIWRLEEKPVIYGIYSTSVALLNFAITLFLVIKMNQGWQGRLYAQFFVAITFFVISLIFLIRRNYLKWNIPEWKVVRESLLFGIPLVPHLASNWIRQGLDRYIVNHFHNVSDVGLFSYAFNFANIILIVGTAFNASNSVFIFKRLSESSNNINSEIKKYTRLIILIFIILTAFIFLASYIFIYEYMPEYSGSLRYLLPLCISMFIQSVYFLYVNYLFFYSKTKILMYITFFVSLLHIILSYLLTPYSIQYTAYISVLSSSLICFMVYLYSKHLLKLNLN